MSSGAQLSLCLILAFPSGAFTRFMKIEYPAAGAQDSLCSAAPGPPSHWSAVSLTDRLSTVAQKAYSHTLALAERAEQSIQLPRWQPANSYQHRPRHIAAWLVHPLLGIYASTLIHNARKVRCMASKGDGLSQLPTV